MQLWVADRVRKLLQADEPAMAARAESVTWKEQHECISIERPFYVTTRTSRLEVVFAQRHHHH